MVGYMRLDTRPFRLCHLPNEAFQTRGRKDEQQSRGARVNVFSTNLVQVSGSPIAAHVTVGPRESPPPNPPFGGCHYPYWLVCFLPKANQGSEPRYWLIMSHNKVSARTL